MRLKSFGVYMQLDQSLLPRLQTALEAEGMAVEIQPSELRAGDYFVRCFYGGNRTRQPNSILKAAMKRMRKA